MSPSGGRWGSDGFLYVTGHDLLEMYVLKLPIAGGRLVCLDHHSAHQRTGLRLGYGKA